MPRYRYGWDPAVRGYRVSATHNKYIACNRGKYSYHLVISATKTISEELVLVPSAPFAFALPNGPDLIEASSLNRWISRCQLIIQLYKAHSAATTESISPLCVSPSIVPGYAERIKRRKRRGEYEQTCCAPLNFPHIEIYCPISLRTN